MFSCLMLMFAYQAFAQTESRIVGDVGLGVYKTPAITRTTDNNVLMLPYLYADYGNFYSRVDTFGYKLLPLGAGHLEIATRLSFEGYRPDNANLANRTRPKPIGFGTFQETPFGAFILYGFRDTVTAGTLLDATYALEWERAGWHIYPQLGIERRSAKYTHGLYGVSTTESTRSSVSTYNPGSSLAPKAAVAFEYLLPSDLKVSFQVRSLWLDKNITDSPLVNAKHQTSSFLAISQTFK